MDKSHWIWLAFILFIKADAASGRKVSFAIITYKTRLSLVTVLLLLGVDSNAISSSNGYPDYTYSMLDAFVPVSEDENAQCKCKRGPRVS